MATPPMPNLTILPPANPNEDIVVFANNCVFMRSIYLHGKTLFEDSSADDKERMSLAAATFFGDLNRMFVEYVILQACKITDPAQDGRKNDNHTVAFLLKHYGLSADPVVGKRLVTLEAKLEGFRQRILPARNKLISHADRSAILAGQPLGAASDAEWNEFWRDLQELVSIIHAKVLGAPFHINSVAMLSDADGWLKALKHAACFDELMADRALTRRCVDLALAKG
jgi:hypothetical protein